MEDNENDAERVDEELSLSSTDNDSLNSVDSQTDTNHQNTIPLGDEKRNKTDERPDHPTHKKMGTRRLPHPPTLLGHLQVHPRTTRTKHHLPPFFASGQQGYSKNTPWFPDDRHHPTPLSRDKGKHKTYNNIHGLAGIQATSTPVNAMRNSFPPNVLPPQGTAPYYETCGQKSTKTPFQQPNYHPLPQHQSHPHAALSTKSPNLGHVDLDNKTMEKLVSRISKRIIRRLEKRLEAKLDALLDSLHAVLGESAKANPVTVRA